MFGDETLRLPFSNDKLSYADDMAPGGNVNGFSPPKPNGEYNILGLGKKNGNDPGKLDGTLADEDDGVGVLVLDSDFLDLEALELTCWFWVE